MKLPIVFEDRELQAAFEDAYERDKAGGELTKADNRLLRSALDRALRFFHVDPLTKLLNDEAMSQLLEETVQHTSSPSYRKDAIFIMTDIDNFKAYNEATNYDKGDKAIIHTFEFLRSIFKIGDQVARIHGDEGAILAPRLGNADTTIYGELEHRLSGNSNHPSYNATMSTLEKGDLLNLSMGFVIIEPNMSAQNVKEYAANALKHVKYLKKHDGRTDINVAQWSPEVDYQPMKDWLSERAQHSR